MKFKSAIFASMGLALMIQVNATELTKTELSKTFQEVTPFKVNDIEDSPLTSFKQVITEKGIFYVSNDGKYLISGTVHKFEKGLKNLTEIRNQKIYSKVISQLSNDFITYRAPNELHEVIVFYDTSCGYCKKMHSQVASYNAKGITIHYAAFPRQGIFNPGTQQYTDGFKNLENIWCSENKNMVFNMSSRGVNAPSKSCQNTIEEQYKLGKQLGVRGTPAAFAMNGKTVVTGYVNPDEMLKRLN